MIGLVLAAGLSVAAPGDEAYRGALELVYNGAFDAAEERLSVLSASAPGDPVGPYLQALALCWKLEQQPGSTAWDDAFLQKTDQALALAEARLGKDRADARARLARGAAFGVRSRYHIFRQHRSDAAKDAVRMREDLLKARAQGVTEGDVRFGLGLYDYYTDVLPKVVKLLRFFAGMPGGDRERGLALLEEAQAGTLFHDTEARVQLYEIYAFYEEKPDRALIEIRALSSRYPGWPRWGLSLAEHLRDRLGLYEESAAVARAVLENAEQKRHPNYQPVVAAMARASLGESLLLDGRFPEARAALLLAQEGSPEAPWVAPRIQLLLGRSLELEGHRDAALAHYRAAAEGGDRELRRRAQAALASPLPAGELSAAQALAAARREREAGYEEEAVEACRRARAAWPRNTEAALCVAESDLKHGRPEEAREILESLGGQKSIRPPWARPWAALLYGELRDLEGHREEAVQEYKKVLQEPYGREALRARAAERLRRPFTSESGPLPVPGSSSSLYTIQSSI
jgi:tetratricopeptide (TPR) repeat protein